MAENKKPAESIGDRLLRETGRVASLVECEKEAMRIERDELKAENKRLAEIITAFLDCDKWLTCKKVATVDCFEECGQDQNEYEEGQMPVITSHKFVLIDMLTLGNARQAWKEIKESQYWRDPRKSLEELLNDSPYKRSWGNIVNLDEFFATGKNDVTKDNKNRCALCGGFDCDC